MIEFCPIISVRTVRRDHPDVPQLLVEVEDAEGRIGIGETWWGVSTMSSKRIGDTQAPLAATVDDLLGPMCIGEDSSRIEKLWHKLMRYAYRYGDEGILRSALSGIDLALWDLLGKRLGVPVAQLMGGTVHDSIAAYASLPRQGELALLVSEVNRALEAGYAGIKVHEYDPDLVVALRSELGSEPILMMDALGHFTPQELPKIARRLADADLLFLETPVFPFREYSPIARASKGLTLPLAIGEHEWSIDGFERLLASGAFEYVQPEISKLGGLTMARRVAAMAERHQIALVPHCYRIGPAFLATLQWALCSPGATWIEVPFLPSGIDFPSGIKVPPLSNGHLSLPEWPGLGSPVH